MEEVNYFNMQKVESVDKRNQSRLVAIISYNIHSSHMNYGAALHSYAFQEYLKDLGIDSVIIDYYPRNLEKYNIKYPFLNNLRFWRVRSFLRAQINWLLGEYNNLLKYRKFNSFFEKYCRKTRRTYSHKDLLRLHTIENIPFDTFVCESDVIWKLYSNGDFDDVFFLNIPSAKHCKKIAYSPSLGSRLFNEVETKMFIDKVKDFHAISTREAQGAKYISALLDKKIDWVLDPTMLLTDDDYSKLAIKPKEEKYLLVYNCMVNDRVMLVEAQRLAKRLNLQMIEISNFYINKFRFPHKVKTDVGIEEFLGYLKYADFIVCNAFHGCCFANIFRKQFFLFQRDKSDYRMENITTALGEGDHFVSCDNKCIPINVLDIDYTAVYNIIDELRQKSRSFIVDSMGINIAQKS